MPGNWLTISYVISEQDYRQTFSGEITPRSMARTILQQIGNDHLQETDRRGRLLPKISLSVPLVIYGKGVFVVVDRRHDTAAGV